MLLRKTARFWKNGLMIISFALILSISGCSARDQNISNNQNTETEIRENRIRTAANSKNERMILWD